MYVPNILKIWWRKGFIVPFPLFIGIPQEIIMSNRYLNKYLSLNSTCDIVEHAFIDLLHVLCYCQLRHNACKPSADALQQQIAAVTPLQWEGFHLFIKFHRKYNVAMRPTSTLFPSSFLKLANVAGGVDFRQYVISLLTAVNKNLKGCLSIVCF